MIDTFVSKWIPKYFTSLRSIPTTPADAGATVESSPHPPMFSLNTGLTVSKLANFR
jgi:hypothetical protein